MKLVLFSDYTGMLDVDRIEGKNIDLVVSGLVSGAVKVGDNAYPIVEGIAKIPASAWTGDTVKIVVTGKERGLLRHWECDTLNKVNNAYIIYSPSFRQVLFQTKIDLDKLRFEQNQTKEALNLLRGTISNKFMLGGR